MDDDGEMLVKIAWRLCYRPLPVTFGCVDLSHPPGDLLD
jgi:hypothetical protein